MNLPYAFLTVDPKTGRPRPLTPYEIVGKVPNPNQPGELLDFRVSAASNPDGYVIESVPVGGRGTVRLYGAPGFDEATYAKAFVDQHGVTDELKLGSPNGAAVSDLWLEIRNGRFVNKDGKRTCYSGADFFMGMRLFYDGELGQLDDTLGQYHELGFRWARTFMQGSKDQNQTFSLSPAEPGYRGKIRPYAEFLNQRGIGLFADCFVDNQDVQTPYSQFTVLAEELVGSTSILSGGNEHPKNGWDPNLLPVPTNGIPWTRGSNLADKLTEPHGAPIACFHQDTETRKSILDSVASAYEMRVVQPAFANTVLICDEPTRFNQNGTNKSHGHQDDPNDGRTQDSEYLAFQLASNYRGNWDMVVFHNEAGRWCQLMQPALYRVASEWARGMRQ